MYKQTGAIVPFNEGRSFILNVCFVLIRYIVDVEKKINLGSGAIARHDIKLNTLA